MRKPASRGHLRAHSVRSNRGFWPAWGGAVLRVRYLDAPHRDRPYGRAFAAVQTGAPGRWHAGANKWRQKTSPAPAKIHMTLMRIFTRTAVLSFGFAVAIGAAAEATPLASDRDMVTGVSVTEADCRAQSGRLWVRAENRGFCVRFWLSTAGGSKDEALVAFHGDIGGRIDGKLQLLEAGETH